MLSVGWRPNFQQGPQSLVTWPYIYLSLEIITHHCPFYCGLQLHWHCRPSSSLRDVYTLPHDLCTCCFFYPEHVYTSLPPPTATLFVRSYLCHFLRKTSISGYSLPTCLVKFFCYLGLWNHGILSFPSPSLNL